MEDSEWLKHVTRTKGEEGERMRGEKRLKKISSRIFAPLNSTRFNGAVTCPNTPRIGNPFCIVTLLFMKRTAPAPSLTWLEFPVTL